jgi:Protein of unknown function (DUF3313)
MTTDLNPRSNSHLSVVLSGLTLSLALATGGCATISAPERSNTLLRFEELSLQSDGTRTWHQASARGVKTVRIDPQAIAFGVNVRLDTAQREALRNSLSQALIAQFSAAGVHVTSASGDGSGAMAVRATVTEVALASPVLNAVTTVLLFAPVSRGSLSVEIEGLDDQNGQRMAALAFSGTAGVNNVGSAFSGLGHAKLQADIAAGKFVQLVTGERPLPLSDAAAGSEPQP